MNGKSCSKYVHFSMSWLNFPQHIAKGKRHRRGYIEIIAHLTNIQTLCKIQSCYTLASISSQILLTIWIFHQIANCCIFLQGVVHKLRNRRWGEGGLAKWVQSGDWLRCTMNLESVYQIYHHIINDCIEKHQNKTHLKNALVVIPV